MKVEEVGTVLAGWMQEGGREPETWQGLGRLAPAQAQSVPTPDAGKIFSKRIRVGTIYAGWRSGRTREAGSGSTRPGRQALKRGRGRPNISTYRDMTICSPERLPGSPRPTAPKPSCESINKLQSVGSPHVTYEEGFPTTRKPPDRLPGSTRTREDHPPRPSPAGRPPGLRFVAWWVFSDRKKPRIPKKSQFFQ